MAAESTANEKAAALRGGLLVQGISLECASSVSDSIEAERLDDRTAKIELLSTRQEGDRTYATIFVPDGSLKHLLKKIERYKNENDARRKDKGPKNKELIESIDSIRLPLVRSFWTDDPTAFPLDLESKTWFEVWLRVPSVGSDALDTVQAFRDECSRLGITVDKRTTYFPERVVLIAFSAVTQWAQSIALLGSIAELRKAKLVQTEFMDLAPRDQVAFVEDGANRIDAPGATAPAVCILDTGIHGSHPLLRAALNSADIHIVDPAWPSGDQAGHGTEMAGLALYGSQLAEHLIGTERFEIRHRLESVKLIDSAHPHDPANYGAVTTEALSLAELTAPARSRVACLAVTADDRDMGFPSSWSAALDQHSAGGLDGRARLYVVSAGNVRDEPFLAPQYPGLNREQRGIEDPGQSWNALTVGAYTERVTITSPEFARHAPVAPLGSLCPTSRTSLMWPDDEWPLKPDVVLEGGNYASEPNGQLLPCDDLRLLTTTVHSSGRLLDTMADTSAATAQAARLSARLMEAYPLLWPETIRGLIVHSAEWNERMLAEFPSTSKGQIKERLRCYGYGVPNEARAFWTIRNSVTLIAQETLTPFEKQGADCKTRDCHLHDLPWPKDVLESLGELPVTLRVTLSYFVEPSPGRRGWTRKFRYASHGLRFAVRGPLEKDDGFAKRLTRSAWSEGERLKTEERPDTAEPQSWLVGYKTRSRGSLHSDSWTAPAAEIAQCGKLAVYPVTGWWRERAHLESVDKATRYSLIVTIHSPDVTTDLLTPIRASIPVVAKR